MLLSFYLLSFYCCFIVRSKCLHLNKPETENNKAEPNVKPTFLLLFLIWCSGMDIFPTLLSLADVTAPSDRHYDGIDATNVLLHGEQRGHEVLFLLSSISLWFKIITFPVSGGVFLETLVLPFFLVVSLPPKQRRRREVWWPADSSDREIQSFLHNR